MIPGHPTLLLSSLFSIWGTLDLGLVLRPSSQLDVVVLLNVDWAGCSNTRVLPLVMQRLVALQAAALSHSSSEVEYRAVANIVAAVSWLCQLLLELHMPLCTCLLLHQHSLHVYQPRSASAPSTLSLIYTSFVSVWL